MINSLLLEISSASVDWARAQFALTAIYHWLFVPLTLGLAIIMGIAETKYYLSKDIDIKDITIQESELTEVRWFSMKELENMVDENILNENQIACFKKAIKYLNKKNDFTDR